MNNRAEQYLTQTLAATGFVLVSPQIAYMLRPDLWRCLQDTTTSFGGDDAKKWLTNHAPTLFRFTGSHSGYGGCFNQNYLPERAQSLYGLRLIFTPITTTDLIEVATSI